MLVIFNILNNSYSFIDYNYYRFISDLFGLNIINLRLIK